jgi:hypothetical protein
MRTALWHWGSAGAGAQEDRSEGILLIFGVHLRHRVAGLAGGADGRRAGEAKRCQLVIDEGFYRCGELVRRLDLNRDADFGLAAAGLSPRCGPWRFMQVFDQWPSAGDRPQAAAAAAPVLGLLPVAALGRVHRIAATTPATAAAPARSEARV